jgi:excisionase family DNA binding protein
MKLRLTQFGVRENTASPRQHASRVATNARISQSDKLTLAIDEDGKSAPPKSPRATNAATSGDTREEGQLLTVQEVAELLRVPVSWVYGRTRKRSSERLPGYRLGKYWRFRANEVLAWVATQKSEIHAA